MYVYSCSCVLVVHIHIIYIIYIFPLCIIVPGPGTGTRYWYSTGSVATLPGYRCATGYQVPEAGIISIMYCVVTFCSYFDPPTPHGAQANIAPVASSTNAALPKPYCSNTKSSRLISAPASQYEAICSHRQVKNVRVRIAS